MTDPDGADFDAVDLPETSDALTAFEQRRRIYPQPSTSSSSDGSVAAAYHSVHDVPRAHHDTLPNDLPSAPVVVRPITEPGLGPAVPPSPLPPPPAARDARDRDGESGRDVSTFPLPRRSPSGSRTSLVMAAGVLVAAGLVGLVIVRAGGSEPSPDAGVAAPAMASATSRVLPSAAVVTASEPPRIVAATLPAAASANAALVGDAAAAAASAPTVNRVPPPKSSPPVPARSGGPAVPRPASSSSNTTPASARPAGDFDDLVREGKP